MDWLVTIGGAIFGTIFNCTVGQAGNQLEYLFSYKDNIENLRFQVQVLDGTRRKIEDDSEQARIEGKAIKGHVQDWQYDAKVASVMATSFLESYSDHSRARCSCRWPLPNLALRQRLSKKAKEMAAEIALEIAKENNFSNDISFRPAVEVSFEQKDFEKFGTRELALSKIMEALQNAEVRMIGLCGIGGMGKSMLVKEVARQAKEGNLFSKQIMAVVSQNPNIEEIQKEIANQLGLEFLPQHAVSTRAELLGKKLKDGEKILLVLDDVWKNQLDNLHKVGIPFKDGNKECKIILTSRYQDVCKAMGADEKSIFEVKGINNEEAMDLFNRIVGDVNPKLESLKIEVIRECGGLPLAIVTIASALNINKSLYFWQNALLQLQRSPTESEIYGEIYKCLKTSFDELRNEAKSLLLICCAHEEDANVSLQELTGYVMVLDLFRNVYTLKEASNMVKSLVDNLKAYCLLSDGNYPRTVKVHDVIRDVAISIASKLEKNPMYCLRESVSFEEDCLSRANFKDLYSISVPGGGITGQLPARLACARLQLLMLRNSGGLEVPDEFFEETEELKALCLDFKGGKQLPPSFRSFQNLKALHLRIWSEEDIDIAIIGKLKNLVILDLSHSDCLVLLPKQIGELAHLQVLNLNGCYRIKVIEPNVIASLVELEELYMENAFVDWKTEGLREVKRLPKLRVLHLGIRDGSVVPEDMFHQMNLESYRIIIGDKYTRYASGSRARVLQVNTGRDISQLLYADGFQMLMKRSDELCLWSIPGASHLIKELDASSFQDLERLVLDSPKNLESLMLTSPPTRSTLFHHKVAGMSFINLQELNIQGCNKIQYLLSFDMVESLKQLKELHVSKCKIMEQMVTKAVGEDGRLKKVSFPKLDSLLLLDLPKLKRFCEGDCIECPSLLTLKIMDCSKFMTFIPNSQSAITLQEAEERELVAQQSLLNEKAARMSLINLQELNISGHNKIQYLLSFDMVESLKQLKRLRVSACKIMEQMVTKAVGEDGRLKKISFPKLYSLQLLNLPKLKRFCEGDCIECPSLLTLEIRDCSEFMAFIPNSQSAKTLQEAEERELVAQQPLLNEKVAGMSLINLQELSISGYNKIQFLLSFDMVESLKQLKKLYVSRCKTMEQMVTKAVGEDGSLKKISFPKLDSLELRNLPKLKRFCEGDCIECPSLLTLKIGDCYEFMTFIPNSQSAITLQAAEKRELVAQQPLLNEKVVGMSLINLQELNISGCNKIQFLLSFDMVESLKQLKRLRVSECKIMEQMVTKVVGEDGRLKKISFPKLDSLELRYLPKLKRFCEGDCIECPSLLTLKIGDCSEFMTFIPNSQSATTLRVVEEKELVALQPLLNEKVAGMSLINLQELNISGCNKIQYLLSFEMVESLKQLKKLYISRCKTMEQMVTKAIGEDWRLKKISFPKLDSLELRYLPKLKRFCEGDCIECPSLLTLKIGDCSEFMTFIPNSQLATTLRAVEEKELAALQPMLNEKVVLMNLRDLVVWKCPGLTSLFSSSTATSLAQLTGVLISECNQMTQVIHVNDQMDNELAAKSEIVLGQLKILALVRLPSLRCFHNGNNKLQFPNLKKTIVSDCPEMKSFSHGTVNAPNLNRLTVAKFDFMPTYFFLASLFRVLEQARPTAELWEGDLNRTIRKLWEDPRI